MTMRWREVSTLGLACALGLACVGPEVALSGRSTATYDPGASRTVAANACGFQLFGWIPINVLNRSQRAYRKLESRAAGDYVTDVKVRERWYYAFVGTLYCTDLRATAYRRPR